MSNRSRRGSLLIGLIGAGAVVAVIAVAPAAEPVRRRIKELPHLVAELPQHAEALAREARERYELAKQAFRSTRAESERALILQLREAKERGSLPPV